MIGTHGHRFLGLVRLELEFGLRLRLETISVSAEYGCWGCEPVDCSL